ncbi:GNAT family N-acetyltransferase [Phyllobacterium sp. YR531]|uniref:GNAT family N-acetyltransferase n=1 Tax=Phyllobacterium sp. YR531 TaxID=1144343 RepID=UPI00026F9851|nr:GNAT family N-acetyltransferase [Phyllobacterium sp. YR531]EJN06114.1 acetyltransferase, ribosomal protein N-acetylase [Phyllobacterium sp. YR531]
MSFPPAKIESSRLFLRRAQLRDASAIFDGYGHDAEVIRYLSWHSHQSIKDTRDYLRQVKEDWDQGKSYTYAICLEKDSPLIGMVMMRVRDERATFGYAMGRNYWGKGYVPEALSTLIDLALAQPDIWRAEAYCDVENISSARVMEKVGMTYEGVLRRWTRHPNVSDAPRDCLMYSKVK